MTSTITINSHLKFSMHYFINNKIPCTSCQHNEIEHSLHGLYVNVYIHN